MRNLAAALGAVKTAHPGQTLQLWCEHEAREGQKGRTGHRWFTRGAAQTAKRFRSVRQGAGTGGSCRPASSPRPARMPAAFRWHGQAALQAPGNVTLLPLPPCSPELDPVERVWSYLRERCPSFRLHRSEQAIVDALCAAWNALRDETGRLTTLTGYPWITQTVIRSANKLIGIKLVFLATTLADLTGLWPAILADTGATVLVTLNALRLLGWEAPKSKPC